MFSPFDLGDAIAGLRLCCSVSNIPNFLNIITSPEEKPGQAEKCQETLLHHACQNKNQYMRFSAHPIKGPDKCTYY
tara:strand:- start:675 stop:902 length:228 start_codon:yes stop_codon:yes gene_type:complete